MHDGRGLGGNVEASAVLPGNQDHREQVGQMRKTGLVTVAMLIGATLTGCTEAERQEAVEPIVREVIESLLAPITAANDKPRP